MYCVNYVIVYTKKKSVVIFDIAVSVYVILSVG